MKSMIGKVDTTTIVALMIGALGIQYAYFSAKVEGLEDAVRVCNSVITPAQREEIAGEYEYRNEAAEALAEDAPDRH